MASLNRLTGTSWHVEKFAREEDDPRRHRSRCKFYNKKDAYCSYIFSKCRGAAHCTYYKEKPVVKECIENADRVCKEKESFCGVRLIEVSDIVYDKKKYKKPQQNKIDTIKQYYQMNGKMDKPVVLSVKGDKYWLEDGYLRLYTAIQMHIERIPARIGSKETGANESRIRKIGARINHKKYGLGNVTAVDNDKVKVLFDSGREVTFNISMIIEKDMITFC